jgi:hypothetical protein
MEVAMTIAVRAGLALLAALAAVAALAVTAPAGGGSASSATTATTAPQNLKFLLNETRSFGISGDFTFRLLTGAGTYTMSCTTSTLRATIAGSVMTIARGDAILTGCPYAITQTADWTIAFDALLNTLDEMTAIAARLTIPVDGAHVNVATFGCGFYVGGSASTLVTLAQPVPLGRLASVNVLPFPAGQLGLAVTTVTANCLQMGFNVGARVDYAGRLGFTPALTGTLVAEA